MVLCPVVDNPPVGTGKFESTFPKPGIDKAISINMNQEL